MQLPPDITKPLIDEAALLIKQTYLQYINFESGEGFEVPPTYDPFATISGVSVGPKFSRTEPFGFIARNKNSNVLWAAFRGPRSLEDWIANFVVRGARHPWGLVEDSFYRLYVQSGRLVRWMPALSPLPSALVLTGHSLGAALAILAASELAILAGQIPLHVITFGGPRVGDPQFAAEYNRLVPSTLRIVNTEDLVPAVPLASVRLNSGKRMLLNSTFLGRMAQVAGSDDFDYQHVGAVLTFTRHVGSISANHSIDLYSSFTDTLSL
jgi:triacylglycerol lipase